MNSMTTPKVSHPVAPVSVEGLPRLPPHVCKTQAICGSFDAHWNVAYVQRVSADEKGDQLFTANQMREYARAAVYAYAMDLAASPPAVPNGDAMEVLRKVTDALVILNARPCPMCRDCADENGTCPGSGLPCDMNALISRARSLASAVAAPITDGGAG